MNGFPQAALPRSPSSPPPADRSRLVAGWLFAVALAVMSLVVVGGATRLTGSGLSITQWKPVTGALPPLSTAAWTDAYHRYELTPQYRLVNRGMSLTAFKSIFWWEWAHRLLARSVGAVFAIPFAALLAARRLPKRLIGPCVGLLALGGLQGLVGWWMVASGLEGRVSVAPERLAVHLGLALLLIWALIWTGLEAWAGPAATRRRALVGWRFAGLVFCLAVFLQCLLGALVAGNHAGLVNADWPLMSGRVVPQDYWRGDPWATFAHSVAAVQFNHRLVAYGLAIFAAGLAVAGWRSRTAPLAVRALGGAAASLVGLQVVLGVVTLIAGAPLALALLHQTVATLLLGTAVALAWRTRRA